MYIMLMFVGRERELKKMNALYDSGHFEFAVFYGRRRVGKTTLIKEFIKDKELAIIWQQKLQKQKTSQAYPPQFCPHTVS